MSYEYKVKTLLEKIATSSGLEKAEEIKKQLTKKLGAKPFLSGSMATGLNIPGKYDYDFVINTSGAKKFKNLEKKLEKSFTPSKFNKPLTDYKVYTGKVEGEDVDIALVFGAKGELSRQAIKRVKKTLSPEERKRIINLKKKYKNLWFFPKLREKRFKASLDQRLGLPRYRRDTFDPTLVKKSDYTKGLNRKDIFGHRTNNLESVMKNGLLSGAQAAKKGLVKVVETNSPFSRGRTDVTGKPHDFRSEVFITKGLMPADSTYGKYGVLFRKRKVEESRYLNAVPEEFLAEKVKSKLTFVVPDHEFNKWKKKKPNHRIIRESEVPKRKRLPSKAYGELFKRIFKGPKLFQKTEKVFLKNKA